MGYLIHLYTDYYWFKNFVPRFLKEDHINLLDKTTISIEENSKNELIYNDYTNLNSDLIDWFNDQSYSIHENEYKHYIVVSQHKILEILSSVPPEIVDGIHFASN